MLNIRGTLKIGVQIGVQKKRFKRDFAYMDFAWIPPILHYLRRFCMYWADFAYTTPMHGLRMDHRMSHDLVKIWGVSYFLLGAWALLNPRWFAVHGF